MMQGRDNLIGIVLLVVCAVVAVVLVFSIITGTRFQYTGPGWVGTALFVVFIGASIYLFVTQPGRRWPWQRDRKDDSRDGPMR
jgi:uncharacterized membrane protein YphA (DoxX/SURF4 family)